MLVVNLPNETTLALVGEGGRGWLNEAVILHFIIFYLF